MKFIKIMGVRSKMRFKDQTLDKVLPISSTHNLNVLAQKISKREKEP